MGGHHFWIGNYNETDYIMGNMYQDHDEYSYIINPMRHKDIEIPFSFETIGRYIPFRRSFISK